jgi:hypothetical protein
MLCSCIVQNIFRSPFLYNSQSMNFLLADYLPSPEVSNTMSVLANFLGGTGSQPTTNASLGSKWNAAPMMSTDKVDAVLGENP